MAVRQPGRAVATATNPRLIRLRLLIAAFVAALPLVVLPWLIWQSTVAAITAAALIALATAAGWRRSRRIPPPPPAVATAAEAERDRVTGELHGIVTDAMTSIVIEAERRDRAAEDALRVIAATGRECLGELQRLAKTLPAVQPGAELVRPGVAQLDALVAGARRAGLRVRLLRCGQLPHLAVSVEQAVFRVVDEALTNVLRHAGQVDVVVSLTYEATALSVIVVNTPSTHEPAVRDGEGLAGLRERVRIVGGEVTAGPTADNGFKVTARFPVSPGSTAIALGASRRERSADPL